MTLSEGQYALDGVVFGDASGAGPLVILESGDATDGAAVRTQDVEAVRGDHMHFGRDYLTPPERHFVVGVDTSDPLRLPRLRELWRADSVRGTPGAVSELTWRLGGETYLALGRPRDFAVLGAASFDPGWQVVELSWQYRDAYALLERPRSVSLGTYAPSAGEGLTLPATLPWLLGSAPSEQRGVVEAGGTVPAPFEVRITGPAAGQATDLVVSGDGWRLDFGTLALKPFETLRVDTFRRTASVNGRSVTGRLTFDSTLGARIRPGLNVFTFTCSDPTATTRADVIWRDPVTLF